MQRSRWWRRLGRLCLLIQAALLITALWHQVWPGVSDPAHRNPWWRSCPAGEHCHIPGTVGPAWQDPDAECHARDCPRAWKAGQATRPCPDSSCPVCTFAETLRSVLTLVSIGTVSLAALDGEPVPVPVLPASLNIKGARLPRGPPRMT